MKKTGPKEVDSKAPIEKKNVTELEKLKPAVKVAGESQKGVVPVMPIPPRPKWWQKDHYQIPFIIFLVILGWRS